MRRLAIIIVALGAVAAVALAALRSDSESTYRVDAVFDTAKGIVPGQLVKVAGARVGTVEAVTLTPENKARIALSVEARFAPFRTDARCEILPEGLISENFVECDPGSAATPLPQGTAGVPTVELERTAVPVSLQEVIDIFSLPAAERVRALINELGIATAGRGEDLNELLRRANPALAQARRALAILADQRHELESAVTQTDRVLARVASRRGELKAFVGRAAGVADETSDHSQALEDAVRELPPMLTAADQGLRSLRRVATSGTPLARELRAAAPSVTELSGVLPAFARTGRPALRALGSAAAVGTPAIRTAAPVIANARTLARQGRPVVRQVAKLVDDVARTGGIESLLTLTYHFAAMSALYDTKSHLGGALIGVYAQCLLLGLNVPGCRHDYEARGNGTIPVNAPTAGPRRPGDVIPPGIPVTNPSRTRVAEMHPGRAKQLLEFLLK